MSPFESTQEYLERNEVDALVQILETHPDVVTESDSEGRTLLHEAVFFGSEQCVRVLLEHGSNANAITKRRRWSPLHECAFNGTPAIARLLIECGSEPSLQDIDGRTALHIAAEDGYVAMVRLLVQIGAPRDVVDALGRTPAELARIRGKGDAAAIIEAWGDQGTRRDE